MVSSIKCINLQDIAECKALTYNSRESFLELNYEFLPGNVYGVVSDFGMGSWGITTCLGGRGSRDKTGKMLLDGVEVSYDELANHSCFVSENIFPKVNKHRKMLTPRLCIQRALKISREPYSVEQVKEMFSLSNANERFDRDLRYVGIEIWRISIAVNFALGKDIFCYPWLNEHDIYMVDKRVVEALREHNKIVLIPTSQKEIVEKFADHLIICTPQKFVFR